MDSTAEERSSKSEDRIAQMSQPEAQNEEKQTGKKKRTACQGPVSL